MKQEEWKDVKGFEGIYQVSSYGRVRSLSRLIHYKNYDRNYKGRILKPCKTVYGYLQVSLRNVVKGNYKAPVHQLVAQAFIPNPRHYSEVHHKDYDKTNNRVENLMWCSRRFNQSDMTHHYKKEKAIRRCESCGNELSDERNTTGLCSKCLTRKRGLLALKRHGISSYSELQSLVTRYGIDSTAKLYSYRKAKLKMFCENHDVLIDKPCESKAEASTI